MRLFDILPNFPFTISETMCNYYLQAWYIRVASRVAERLKAYDPRTLGNIRKVSKPYRMVAQCPAPPEMKVKVLSMLEKNYWNLQIKRFPQCANSHDLSLKYLVNYIRVLQDIYKKDQESYSWSNRIIFNT